jgi:hypothetical protein
MATPPNPRKQQQRPRQPPSLQKVERYGQGGRGSGGGGGGANIHQSLTAQERFPEISIRQTQALKQSIQTRIQGIFEALCGIVLSNNKQQIIGLEEELKPPSQNLKSSIQITVTDDIAKKWHTILCFQYMSLFHKQKFQKQPLNVKDILKTYLENVVETTQQKLKNQIMGIFEGKSVYLGNIIAGQFAQQIINCVTLQLSKELNQKYGDCSTT